MATATKRRRKTKALLRLPNFFAAWLCMLLVCSYLGPVVGVPWGGPSSTRHETSNRVAGDKWSRARIHFSFPFDSCRGCPGEVPGLPPAARHPILGDRINANKTGDGRRKATPIDQSRLVCKRTQPTCARWWGIPIHSRRHPRQGGWPTGSRPGHSSGIVLARFDWKGTRHWQLHWRSRGSTRYVTPSKELRNTTETNVFVLGPTASNEKHSLGDNGLQNHRFRC